MANGISPKELSHYIRLVAAGIDAAKQPRADLVGSDIRCAIAAVNGDEGAVKRVRKILADSAPAKPADQPRTGSDDPIALRFSGSLSEDGMKKVAAEIAKRRPGLQGKKLQFELTAKPV